MEEIAIRIFGSESCTTCQSVKKAFEFYAIGYEYIDVNDPKNEKLCDDHNVNELPQIEAYYPKINKTFYVKKGYYSPTQFLNNCIKETENLERELGDKNSPISQDYDKAEIQKMMRASQNNKSCSKCSRNKNVK